MALDIFINFLSQIAQWFKMSGCQSLDCEFESSISVSILFSSLILSTKAAFFPLNFQL